jgi:Spy/CpxP family protein refolding chaperone
MLSTAFILVLYQAALGSSKELSSTTALYKTLLHLTEFLPPNPDESVSNEAGAMGFRRETNMKSTYFKIAAIAIAITLVAAVGVSQTLQRVHMHHGGMYGGHMLRFFTHYLDLTDAQQAQAKEILAKEKPSLQPLLQQVMQGQQQLHQLAMSGYDENKAREIATQQVQTLTELSVQRARIESEFVQILTPEQKTKLNDFFTRHQQRVMQHMQSGNQSQNQ